MIYFLLLHFMLINASLNRLSALSLVSLAAWGLRILRLCELNAKSNNNKIDRVLQNKIDIIVLSCRKLIFLIYRTRLDV